MERIWKIRDYIQELENVKDEIIEFISSDNDIDNGIYDCTYGESPEGHRRMIDD